MKKITILAGFTALIALVVVFYWQSNREFGEPTAIDGVVGSDVQQETQKKLERPEVEEEKKASGIQELENGKMTEIGALLQQRSFSRYARLVLEDLDKEHTKNGNIGPPFALMRRPDVPIDEFKWISKALLQHSDPSIRFAALRNLYMAEERETAFPVLMGFLTDPPGETEEERRRRHEGAIGMAVDFRDLRAKDAIWDYYKGLDIRDWRRDHLISMGVTEIISPVLERAEKINRSPATTLARLAPADHIDELKVGYEVYSDAGKALVAGALYEQTGEQEYFDYLKALAQPAVDDPNERRGSTSNDHTRAFKYLAKVKRPEVKAYLEESLESANQQIVEYALTNLLMVHGDSPKALAKLVELIDDRHFGDMTHEMRLAFVTQDPTVLHAAKAMYGDGGDDSFWHRFDAHDQYLSPYLWVDQYIEGYYIEDSDKLDPEVK